MLRARVSLKGVLSLFSDFFQDETADLLGYQMNRLMQMMKEDCHLFCERSYSHLGS